MMWFGFAGAAVAAAIVYALGSLGRDGLTPIKIVLAGTAISALFASFTQAILVLDGTGLQDVLFWLAGSVSGRTLDMLYPVLPYMTAAAIVSLFMGRAINLLLTGDDIAKGMGQNVLLVKVLMGVVTVLLAGGSVAVAGSIGLVGLVVPHIMRALVGNDYRWLVPYSIVGSHSAAVRRCGCQTGNHAAGSSTRCHDCIDWRTFLRIHCPQGGDEDMRKMLTFRNKKTPYRCKWNENHWLSSVCVCSCL